MALYIRDIQGEEAEKAFDEFMGSDNLEHDKIRSHVRKILKDNEKMKTELERYQQFFNTLGNMIPARPSMHNNIC